MTGADSEKCQISVHSLRPQPTPPDCAEACGQHRVPCHPETYSERTAVPDCPGPVLHAPLGPSARTAPSHVSTSPKGYVRQMITRTDVSSL